MQLRDMGTHRERMNDVKSWKKNVLSLYDKREINFYIRQNSRKSIDTRNAKN